MHNPITKLIAIEKEIQSKKSQSKVIVVSKTFPLKDIIPLINHGHMHFGENKVQEAVEKWTTIKQDFKDIKLHMIGKLQTNKVKFVLPLFDYIHSLDNLKLAEKISLEQKKKNKRVNVLIQVNIGNETQKSGIDPENLRQFYNKCITDFNLNIVGLMCIPPKDENKESHFKKMNELLSLTNLKELSMGMSDDYMQAVQHNSTFVRIGTKILGPRT